MTEAEFRFATRPARLSSPSAAGVALPPAEKKMAVPEGTAKFREETSKKAGEAAYRLAAGTGFRLGIVRMQVVFRIATQG